MTEQLTSSVLPPVVSDVDAVTDHLVRPATTDDLVATFARYERRLPHIHAGWFSETLPRDLPDRVAAAYFDGDFYDSIMASLEAVWPRLSPNGLILIDDYADLERSPRAWSKLPGVKAACDDFFADKTTRPFVLVGCRDLAMGGRARAVPETSRRRGAA